MGASGRLLEPAGSGKGFGRSTGWHRRDRVGGRRAVRDWHRRHPCRRGTDALIAEAPALELVDRVLADAGMLAWYAMAGPDIGQRLVPGLMAYARMDQRALAGTAPADLVDRIDSMAAGLAGGTTPGTPVAERYRLTHDRLRERPPALGPYVPTPVREHLVARAGRAVDALASVLARPLELAVVPRWGNPLATANAAVADQALATLDRLPASVAAWFEVRDAVVAKVAPSNAKRALWRSFRQDPSPGPGGVKPRRQR